MITQFLAGAAFGLAHMLFVVLSCFFCYTLSNLSASFARALKQKPLISRPARKKILAWSLILMGAGHIGLFLFLCGHFAANGHMSPADAGVLTALLGLSVGVLFWGKRMRINALALTEEDAGEEAR